MVGTAAYLIMFTEEKFILGLVLLFAGIKAIVESRMYGVEYVRGIARQLEQEANQNDNNNEDADVNLGDE